MKILALLFLSACTASSPWSFDSLGSAAPDSNRLIYRSSGVQAPLSFEFVSSGDQIAAYLSTTGRRLGKETSATARLSLGPETLEEELVLHEGGMRARLPDSWTVKAIEALKERLEVAIFVGTLEQTIQPEGFLELFEKMAKQEKIQ